MTPQEQCQVSVKVLLLVHPVWSSRLELLTVSKLPPIPEVPDAPRCSWMVAPAVLVVRKQALTLQAETAD